MTCLARTSLNIPSTFITGYPQTPAEKAQSRSAIKANASRARWRKGALPTRSAPVPAPGLRNAPQVRSTKVAFRAVPGSKTPSALQRHLSDPQGVLLPVNSTRRQPTSGELAQWIANKAFDTTTLPLPIPAAQLSHFSTHEIRKLVHQHYEAFTQILPADESGHNSRAVLWTHRIMSEPGVLSAFVFAQLSRNVHEHGLAPNLRRQLVWTHAAVVETVNKALSSAATACTDTTLLTVFSLAYHGSTSSAVKARKPARAPQQGPLKSLRLLHLYGGPIEAVSMHREALLKMIEMRGGLRKMTLPGFAGLLC
jgi:hypothetical protein